MEAIHRETLRKAHPELVDNIRYNDICDHLLSSGIFPTDTFERIKVQQTNADKIRELLCSLPLRGSDAYDKFLNVLKQSHCQHAIKIISREESKLRGPTSPSVSEEDVGHPIQCVSKDSPMEIGCPAIVSDAVPDKAEATDLEESVNPGHDVTDGGAYMPPSNPSRQTQDYKRIHDVYNMKHKKRGLALIINNINFGKKDKHRIGASVDGDCLKQRFQELGFDVIVEADKTVDQMETILKGAAELDHSEMDCFVCAILSHGNNDGVKGNDWKTMKITDIIDPFKGHNCTSLLAKPKLFFIQACRGTDMDGGVPVHSDCSTPQKDNMEIEDYESVIPIEADILVHYSTVEGYKAMRNEVTGSWFIQALSNQLQKHGKTMELLHLLTRVNHDVAVNCETLFGKKQMPQLKSQLLKQLYF